jgi:hypothetical protein
MTKKNGFVNFLNRDNILVNADTDSYNAYLKGRVERAANKSKLDQINNINKDIEELKTRFSRLEELLIQVLEKNK